MQQSIPSTSSSKNDLLDLKNYESTLDLSYDLYEPMALVEDEELRERFCEVDLRELRGAELRICIAPPGGTKHEAKDDSEEETFGAYECKLKRTDHSIYIQFANV